MPKLKRLLLENACYHITTRGNQRQTVFDEESDYKHYLMLLVRYKKRYGFKLHGYCLMPNHVHLIGEWMYPLDLSNVMHDLNRAYTSYFNFCYKKVGHLWQGRFKSRVIVKDRYLINCITYIELNPVRANIIDNPMDYLWSSYSERVTEKANNGVKLLDDFYV